MTRACSVGQGRLVMGRSAPAGRGFSLVELLIVVGIIALLVAILMPALGNVRDLAQRSTCATNLNNIGRGLVMYESEFNEYPRMPLNGGEWHAAVGDNRTTAPSWEGDATAVNRSPSSSLFMLVVAKNCAAKMFVCPATRGEEAVKEGGAVYDFASGKSFSYAVMCPYGNRRHFDSSADPDMPILADSSPYFDPDTGTENSEAITDWSTDPLTEELIAAGNSPNHKRKGQNVCVLGGATTFEERADVGPVFDAGGGVTVKDNIYTRGDPAANGGMASGGGLPESGTAGDDASQGPASASDCFLVQ